MSESLQGSKLEAAHKRAQALTRFAHEHNYVTREQVRDAYPHDKQAPMRPMFQYLDCTDPDHKQWKEVKVRP